MIECIFTLDYEIYGNGQGDLESLVRRPTEELLSLFTARGQRFVIFVEAAELQAIEYAGTDPAIGAVRSQVQRAHRQGFEIGLHIHPQWFNAVHRDGRWVLDYDEYNLCRLPLARMETLVDRSLDYLRDVVTDSGFVPTSFRAGNWLFQPSEALARVLSERGIRLDSSVFKGGLQHVHGLDYRRAARNGYWWRFCQRVEEADPAGHMVEIPTYTQLVPPWRMLTRKRLSVHQRAGGSRPGTRLAKLRDLARWRYPLKLDFCRMTLPELLRMIDGEIRADKRDPATMRPLVAIGHAKDLLDLGTVDLFLDALQERGIAVTTLREIYARLTEAPQAAALECT